ncbi:hypothetical protein NL676_023620 [Syzygium grande]|nr:hypothetical protein NL676_023620 [Syzygium grande]
MLGRPAAQGRNREIITMSKQKMASREDDDDDVDEGKCIFSVILTHYRLAASLLPALDWPRTIDDEAAAQPEEALHSDAFQSVIDARLGRLLSSPLPTPRRPSDQPSLQSFPPSCTSTNPSHDNSLLCFSVNFHSVLQADLCFPPVGS